MVSKVVTLKSLWIDSSKMVFAISLMTFSLRLHTLLLVLSEEYENDLLPTTTCVWFVRQNNRKVRKTQKYLDKYMYLYGLPPKWRFPLLLPAESHGC